MTSIKNELARGPRWRDFFQTYPEPYQFDGVIGTLIHELTHVRKLHLKHGGPFERLVEDAKRKLIRLEIGAGKGRRPVDSTMEPRFCYRSPARGSLTRQGLLTIRLSRSHPTR